MKVFVLIDWDMDDVKVFTKLDDAVEYGNKQLDEYGDEDGEGIYNWEERNYDGVHEWRLDDAITVRECEIDGTLLKVGAMSKGK